MISAAPIRARRPLRDGRRRAVPVAHERVARRRLELERLADGWELALDAADRALDANRETFVVAEAQLRRQALVRERAITAELLGRLARTAALLPTPWQAPLAPARRR